MLKHGWGDPIKIQVQRLKNSAIAAVGMQVKGLGFGNRHHWCKMVNLMARHIDLIAPNHVLTTRPSQLSQLAHTKTKTKSIPST